MRACSMKRGDARTRRPDRHVPSVTRTDTQPLARPSFAVWGPFVAVMLVLGALTIAPLLTSARVQRLRTPLADGAEPAKVTIVADHQIEVAIGGDRFRLPATMKGKGANSAK